MAGGAGPLESVVSVSPSTRLSPAVVDAAFWRGRRVLVTGHTVFKGSWLTLWLLELGALVHGLARDVYKRQVWRSPPSRWSHLASPWRRRWAWRSAWARATGWVISGIRL